MSTLTETPSPTPGGGVFFFFYVYSPILFAFVIQLLYNDITQTKQTFYKTPEVIMEHITPTIYNTVEDVIKNIDTYNKYQVDEDTNDFEVLETPHTDIELWEGILYTYESNDHHLGVPDGWLNVSSRYTNQHGSPDVMHTSETLGEGMIRDLAERGETFALVDVYDGDTQEPYGWAVLVEIENVDLSYMAELEPWETMDNVQPIDIELGDSERLVIVPTGLDPVTVSTRARFHLDGTIRPMFQTWYQAARYAQYINTATGSSLVPVFGHLFNDYDGSVKLRRKPQRLNGLERVATYTQLNRDHVSTLAMKGKNFYLLVDSSKTLLD